MATRRVIQSNGKRPSLAAVKKGFWTEVRLNLVKSHRLRPEIAERAVNSYRRRVGVVALNAGSEETAADINASVRNKLRSDRPMKEANLPANS